MKKSICIALTLFLCVGFACNRYKSSLEIEWTTDDPIQVNDEIETCVVQKETFSADRISSMLSALVGENYVLCKQYVRSKQEWLDMATQMEAAEHVSEDVLNEIKEKAIHAPENPSYEPIRLTEASDGEMAATILERDGGVSYALFDMGGNSFSYYRSEDIQFVGKDVCEQNLLFCSSDFEKEHLLWLMPHPTISEKDSLATAADYIEKMDIPLRLFYYEPCTIITDSVIRSNGWKFIFTKQSNGYAAQFWDGQWYYINPDAPPVSGSSWGEEVCSVVIDENGVCAFSWIGASREISRNKNDKLLPDSEMKSVIDAQLFKIYKDHSYREGVYLDLQITKIEAGISLISVNESPNLGQYVPSWYISYRYKWNDDEDIPESWEQDQIIFNMINGDYIEPRVTEEKLNSILQGG